MSEDGRTTWSKASFTAAIASNTVTLTRTSGSWAASAQIRYCYGGPIESFVVSQANRTTAYANENTDLDNTLYESRTDAAPSNGSGIVQGVPFAATYTSLVAA